ncbi:MAG: ABC transporter ATP-binding protein [Lawsonibacter sp.]|nr:ABC transporter ATP-binding protein [Lawsonibacter sp.]
MLEIKNLTKIYPGNVKAVNNLSLTVENGDLYGFIGHNGAGKTTTIKAVVGIHSFEEGVILINGLSIKSHPVECKKSMAYIPDSPDLYEFMSGNRYLNFVSNMYDLPMAQRKERIEKYSKAFEIEQVLSSSISSYSHGMKQKVALIAALIHEPKLLVLDEPFVGLDPKAAYTLKEYFHQMTAEGCSIFFSTHGLEVAQKLCNKIAIIKNGKLIESGKTEDVVGNKSLEDVFLELTEGVSGNE